MADLLPELLSGVLVLASGCDKPVTYSTTVEVMQVQRFGQDPRTGAGITDLELKFIDCPGDARDIVRGDKTFGQCGVKFKKGDKIKADVVARYSAERGQYRSQIVRLDDCPVNLDPKEEANYEMVQDCKDLVVSGVTVGVHCDRTRNDELVAKCPWFRRR